MTFKVFYYLYGRKQSKMMKKLIVFATLLSLTICAHAQMFDFSSNAQRYEAGFNLGQMATGTPYARLGFGVNALVWGFYADFNKVTAQHKFDGKFSDKLWEDDESFSLHAGYQIPVFRWLRIMPVVGYAQTNQGLTDASTINVETGENSSSVYHTYTVTPGSRVDYFDYGGGISIQPLKWFSINFVYTRFAYYGGIAIDLGAVAGK